MALPAGWGGFAPSLTLLSLRVSDTQICTVNKDVSVNPMQVQFHLLLTRCMICAERKPQDPWFPRLKLVGVYPVMCSWAYINLEDLTGKGEEYDSPLYVVPGGASHMHLTMMASHHSHCDKLHI